MRAGSLFVLASFALCSCAQSDAQDAEGADSAFSGDALLDGDARDVATDASARDTLVADTRDHEVDVIFPVDDGAVGLCATPPGTTVTASGAYMSTPDSVVDGDQGTGWNAGSSSGWVRLRFPRTLHFDRIRIAAGALPACVEPYTFRMFVAGAEVANAASAMTVAEGSNWLPEVDVTPGDYDELMVDVGSSASWIAIAEVVVFESTAICPAP